MNNSMHPFGLGARTPAASTANSQALDLQNLITTLEGLNLGDPGSPQNPLQAQAIPVLGQANQDLSLSRAITLYIEQAYGTGMEPWDSLVIQDYLQKIIEHSIRELTQDSSRQIVSPPNAPRPNNHPAREA